MLGRGAALRACPQDFVMRGLNWRRLPACQGCLTVSWGEGAAAQALLHVPGDKRGPWPGV